MSKNNVYTRLALNNTVCPLGKVTRRKNSTVMGPKMPRRGSRMYAPIYWVKVEHWNRTAFFFNIKQQRSRTLLVRLYKNAAWDTCIRVLTYQILKGCKECVARRTCLYIRTCKVIKRSLTQVLTNHDTETPIDDGPRYFRLESAGLDHTLYIVTFMNKPIQTITHTVYFSFFVKRAFFRGPS